MLSWDKDQNAWAIKTPSNEILYLTSDSGFAIKWLSDIIDPEREPYCILPNGVPIYKVYRGIKQSYYYTRYPSGAIKHGCFAEDQGNIKEKLNRIFGRLN
jgi:hypothetical protein